MTPKYAQYILFSDCNVLLYSVIWQMTQWRHWKKCMEKILHLWTLEIFVSIFLRSLQLKLLKPFQEWKLLECFQKCCLWTSWNYGFNLVHTYIKNTSYRSIKCISKSNCEGVFFQRVQRQQIWNTVAAHLNHCYINFHISVSYQFFISIFISIFHNFSYQFNFHIKKNISNIF